MAHAVRIRTAGRKTDNLPDNAGPPKWDADELHQRVVEGVFSDDFVRVLAGENTEEGFDDRDQEQPMNYIEDDVGAQPDHFLGLYRTADGEDLDEFIEAFEEEVVYDAEWFLIEPHDCTHDRDEGGPCKVYDGDELEDKMARRGDVPEPFASA